jgi:hypothetical protein
MNSSLSKEEKVEKLLDILHEVDKPIEYSDIKRKRYPEFFYKKEASQSIDNEPNICIPSWDTDSIHINTTKSNTNIEDKVGLLDDKDGFVSDEEFKLFGGPLPF